MSRSLAILSDIHANLPALKALLADIESQGILCTRAWLCPEHRAWLGALPLIWQGNDCEAVHASLPHPENWDYVRDPSAAAWHFRHQRQRVCFIGHSHWPAMFIEGCDHALDLTSLESIRPDRKQVVNVGSVGQLRDKDERACYLIYRRDRQDVWWRRVAYDVSATQSAILAAGLPMKFAQRLALGK